MIARADGEVIVVDQVPDAPLPEDVPAIAELKYIVLDKPSMVVARNIGISQARGEIVIFLDDDILPLPGLIQGHLAAYADPDVGAVAGRILDPGQETEMPLADPRSFDLVNGWEFAHFDHATPGDVMTARGCNMSFRRDLLVKLGGFDPHFEIFRDDTDMCLRVIAAGTKVRFVPSAALIHLNAPSGGTRVQSPRHPSDWERERNSYRQHFRHYRDNLCFLLTYFRGKKRLQHVLRAYRSYVGFSRWPWRVVGKNIAFFLALWKAARLARFRRYHECTLFDKH